MVDSAHWVRPLSELGRDDLPVAGGKGANLAELLRAGVRVPPGFVVTTDAHAAAGDDGVPPEVAQAIVAAYAELGRGPVAVRSSATAEDLPGAAFAGQQDTFLDVEGEPDLLDAVRRCWASLWSERAVAYRERRGIDDRQVRMAVVVQRMVPAEVAGVAFTANPVTGARTETVIDAGLGLGEAVVSGTVTAEHLVVDPRFWSRPPGETSSAGPALTRLGAEGVSHLVAVSARIANHFGAPQDVEWAYADQELWIVQARPMTALPPPPVRLSRPQQGYIGMVAELLPVRPYPLDMTTWVVRGHGRILTRMADEIAGLQVDLAAMLPEVDGVVDRLVPVRFRPTWRTLGVPLRIVRSLGSARRPPPPQPSALAGSGSRQTRPRYGDDLRAEPSDPGRWTEDPRFVAFDADVRRLRAVAVGTLGWRDLLARVDEAFGVLDRFITLRIDYLPGVAARIVRLRLLLGILGLSSAYGGLIAGITTRTGDANRALRAVGVSPHTLAAYLDEYGHREMTSAFLVSQPTWGEDPEVVRRAAAAVVTAPPSRGHRTAERSMVAVQGRRRVRLLRLGPWIAAAAAAARGGIAFREDSHFHASRLLPIVRGALLVAGERLSRAGVLDRPADVWHLRWAELTAIADPDAMSTAQRDQLRGAVADRAARREAYGGAPLISPASLRPARETADALVTGSPASAGVATGPVRVVRGPEEFDRLQAGEVLVCPYTNPAWTPLFEVAVAAVVDTGSVGSHAAITAREYGIPAVMGTGRGTTLLADGQRVTVDGSTGAVRAAEDPSDG